MKLSDAERDQLKTAMMEFATRVMQGNCTPQETATLHAVLGELFDEDHAKNRMAMYNGN